MDPNIGRPVRRKEDHRLLTGRGEFSDDHSVAGQTHAVMVRSPYAHAAIRSIDSGIARQMPGVLGIFTGADCASDGLGAIPHSPFPSTDFDMKLHAPGKSVGEGEFIGDHIPLPADKARYVGEPVAMVVAETKAQATDAAEAIEIDFELLPAVTGTVASADRASGTLAATMHCWKWERIAQSTSHGDRPRSGSA